MTWIQVMCICRINPIYKNNDFPLTSQHVESVVNEQCWYQLPSTGQGQPAHCSLWSDTFICLQHAFKPLNPWWEEFRHTGPFEDVQLDECLADNLKLASVAKFTFTINYMTLTETSVGCHGPGEGANLPCVLVLPQTLQLGNLTGRADECAQALRREQRSEVMLQLGPPSVTSPVSV